jgi:ribonuclease HI
MKLIEIFCDGSGTTWDKCGGFGWVILVDGVFHSEASGHAKRATNNDMEMSAAINGLLQAAAIIKRYSNERLYAFEPKAESIKVKLCSDSQIVLGWANGTYRFKQEEKFARFDVLRTLFENLKAEAVWIKGHNGHKWNERADVLAHYGRTGEWPRPKRVKKAK